MKTIDLYEKKSSSELKSLYKDFEKKMTEVEILIKESDSNLEVEHLKKIMGDYEIDISLIRMELNKRLWNSKFND